MRARLTVALLVLLAVVGAAAAPASHAETGSTTITVAFDDMGPWTGFYNMDPFFFKSDGISFGSDYMVGFSNGHAVLVPAYGLSAPPFTMAASFTRPVESVSASIRMGMQGTAEYMLVAYSASGDAIASSTITLTQNGLDGNFYTVGVENLPVLAKSFAIFGGIDYGVRSITYTYLGGRPAT
jgi:hypothetical protein